MIIIPAIDIHAGRCVRMTEGGARPETVYADDPLTVARRWSRQGARWLHVIDCDGLAVGRPVQLALVGAIAAVGVPVQVGGGFRTMEDVEAGFASGVARVLVDSDAVNIAEAASRRFGDKVAALLAVQSDRVVASHKGGRSPDPIGLGKVLVARGIRRIIYTDLARDGSLAGPDLPSLEAFVRTVGAPVIAAGGVASLDDLVALERLGVEGVVVGRALYEGQLDLLDLTSRQGA
ncbi:MAG: HisA/HisF-related TIM barrel protein [Armatimonadota bacterium]|nr:HisA/HisF-related TIM barrel protein [Armatimonadota bacterium]MDR7485286.1 HisA/HisF-related TIM barrel protein [Armatimonadota bacterium]MDR7533876.1 HisA/HisF-related TIM barrel protein [Armatimonadota bacterium]MDR7537162.1 HisA/HisF-related TIM barrel protein [Armatimonadota bacterium]